MFGISIKIPISCTPNYLTNERSTLVQVMAYCRKVTDHYLEQYWPWSQTPYKAPRQQWIKQCSPINLVEFGITHWSSATCGMVIVFQKRPKAIGVCRCLNRRQGNDMVVKFRTLLFYDQVRDVYIQRHISILIGRWCIFVVFNKIGFKL